MSPISPPIETKYLTKTIAVGYLLILTLISGIVYIWSYEKQELDALEKENKKIDNLRNEIHQLYMGIVDLTLMGENLLDMDHEDWILYNARLASVDSMIIRFKGIYPSNKIDSVCIILKNKEKICEEYAKS